MEKLQILKFIKKDDKQVFVFLISSILITLLFSEKYNSLSIIITGIVLLIIKRNEFKKSDLKKYKGSILVFVLAVLGMLWTNSLSSGFKSLERLHLFLTLPLIFSFVKISREDIKLCNNFFFSAVSIVIIYYFLRCILLIIAYGSFYYYENLQQYYFFTYTRLTPDITPTYFSIIIAYSLFYFMKNSRSVYDFLGRYVTYIFLIIQVLFFFLIFARASQVLFLVVFVVFNLSIFKKPILWPIIILVVLTLVLFRNSSFFDRYNRFFKIEQLQEETIISSLPSLGFRLNVVKGVYENKYKFMPFGLGTGSQRNGINVLRLSKEYMNSHNQLIEFFIQWGFLGVFIFLYFFIQVINFSKPVFSDNLLMFIVFIFLLSFTENILIRQRGIVITVLAYCFIVNKSNNFIND